MFWCIYVLKSFFVDFFFNCTTWWHNTQQWSLPVFWAVEAGWGKGWLKRENGITENTAVNQRIKDYFMILLKQLCSKAQINTPTSLKSQTNTQNCGQRITETVTPMIPLYGVTTSWCWLESTQKQRNILNAAK